VVRWAKPDLLLIDGGKGQLSSALKALDEQNINIPTLGLAKRREQVVIRDDKGFKIVELPKDSHVRKLLIRIRDEAHRFALTYQDSLARKQSTKSLVEEIEGIGPVTRKKLIKEFGSIKAALNSDEEALSQVVGPSKAKIISNQFGKE